MNYEHINIINSVNSSTTKYEFSYSLKILYSQGREDGSVVTGMFCFSRGPVLGSQHPPQVASGDLTLSSGLCRYLHVYICKMCKKLKILGSQMYIYIVSFYSLCRINTRE